MKEGAPSVRKEGNTPVPSLEAIDQALSIEQDQADKDLEIIGESMRALAGRIEQDRPDALVFLDISARILATPYHKYLSEKMGEDAPLTRFYNDHDLKGEFLAKNELDKIVQKDFAVMKDKKVFFIDETFSEGKGALALLQASAMAGIDAHYFALTKDPETPSEKMLSEEDDASVQQNIQDGRIVVYDNPIHNLFSRFGSRLYVKDVGGKTRPVQVSIAEATSKSSIPSADKYMKPPDGMTMTEYQVAASAKFDAATREMKEKIYQTLLGKPDSSAQAESPLT